MTDDLTTCIKESFSLRLSELQRNVLDTMHRFSEKKLRPLVSLSATTRSMQRDALLGEASALGIEHFLSAQSDEEELSSHFLLTLTAEELGTGDLESAIDILLPCMVAHLLTLMPGNEIDASMRSAILSGDVRVAIGTPAVGDASKVWMFGRHDATVGVIPIITPDGTRLCVTKKGGRLCTGNATNASMDVLGGWIANRHEPSWETWELSGKQAKELMWVCRAIAIALSAVLVGAMRSAVTFSQGYTEQRVSFGKPIVQHQVVAARFADLLIYQEASKLMTWQSSFMQDGEGLAALATQIRDASQNVFRDTLQLCGAHGYVEGLPTYGWFQISALVAGWLYDFAHGLPVALQPTTGHHQCLSVAAM